MKNNRIEWLDVARGIVIILMVIGHSSVPGNIHKWIYSFHMPFFFFISGMLISKLSSDNIVSDISKYIVRKTNSLLIPFAIYSIINILLFPLYNKSTSFINFIKNIIINGWGGYALWFIPVFYISNILSRVFTVNKTTTYTALVLLTLIGIMFDINNIYLPWNISTIPVACTYIILGYFLKGYCIKIIDINNKTAYTSIFFVSLITSYAISQTYSLDMAWNKITPIIPTTIAAVCGIIAIFLISKFLIRYRITKSLLQYIGRHTFEILAFSQAIILTINANCNVNTVIKYILLIIFMVMICYIKDKTDNFTKISTKK